MSGSTIRPVRPEESAARFSADEEALLYQASNLPPGKAAPFLIHLAAAFWRSRQLDKFADVFRRAYRAKPIGALDSLAAGSPHTTPLEIRDMAQALIARGVRYATVLGDLAMAEAQLGARDEARRLVDYARFFHRGHVALPPGTGSDAFNDAVAAEIKADLTFYGDVGGGIARSRSIRQGWRNNDVMRAMTPALRMLRAILEAEIQRYIAALPNDPGNPFIAAQPLSPRLGGWAVVSGRDSRHLSHLHPAAWITGVYYVTQPQISHGSQAGWLRVGPPPKRGVDEIWETRMVEPARGSFVLMPAYFFHDTEPMGVADERICIAFEMQHGDLHSPGDSY